MLIPIERDEPRTLACDVCEFPRLRFVERMVKSRDESRCQGSFYVFGLFVSGRNLTSSLFSFSSTSLYDSLLLFDQSVAWRG